MTYNVEKKYRPYQPVYLPDRTWPNRTILNAPDWCSVDLRDGNQALIDPMGVDRKHKMFSTLLRMGFKEIEVGFPAASRTDFDFIRYLIEGDHIPDGIAIQVLTQARDDLIHRTFEAIRGAKRAIVHLYNSTSELQRRVVFRASRSEIVDLARRGAESIHRLGEMIADNCEVIYEYTPESFTGTELDFSKEICEAVMDIYNPTQNRKLILNLPATVEMSTPNIYADQIEWFHRNIRNRDAIVLSVHTHNDRGTAVAAAELALMAGADRIEGTLFGNGEITGNVCLVTLAMNLYSQGIDPGLDCGNIRELARIVENCNRLPVHPRHPYAGELVFTAFSGSHQDAINKGLKAFEASEVDWWEVPYLPIDPKDVGCTYEAVIRINSQSGKGGLAYVMEHERGLELPRRLQIEFSKVVQEIADREGTELTTDRIWCSFEEEYIANVYRFSLRDYYLEPMDGGTYGLSAVMNDEGNPRSLSGAGSGPIEAFLNGLATELGLSFDLVGYHEHPIGAGGNAMAAAYVELRDSNRSLFGAGIDRNIVTASLLAVTSAVNRLLMCNSQA